MRGWLMVAFVFTLTSTADLQAAPRYAAIEVGTNPDGRIGSQAFFSNASLTVVGWESLDLAKARDESQRIFNGLLVSHLGSLAGDYNENGTVDAADYCIWRDSHGEAGSGLAADGNENGRIDSGDYDVWKSHFGERAGGTVHPSFPVPEPSSGLILSAAIALLAQLCRQRR